jgi:hypothetical protein
LGRACEELASCNIGHPKKRRPTENRMLVYECCNCNLAKSLLTAQKVRWSMNSYQVIANPTVT